MSVLAQDGSLKVTTTTQDHEHSAVAADGGNTIDLDGTGEITLDGDGDVKIYATGAFPRLDMGGTAHYLPGSAESITKTVKTSGGDFTTVQAAVDWFEAAGRFIGTSCTIALDPGVWSENIRLDALKNFYYGGLTLQGDTRALAGMSWVDGAPCNLAGVSGGGSGTVSIVGAGNNITVTATGGNPDFTGWVSGDDLYYVDNAGGKASRVISSVSSNVITCTAAAPGIGNDGTSITLIPNTRLGTAAGGTALTISQGRARVDGIWVIGAGIGVGLACAVDTGGIGVFTNCLFTHAYYGVLTSFQGYANVASTNTSYYNTLGYFAYSHSVINATYAVAAGCTTGLYADRAGAIDATQFVSSRMTGWHISANQGSFVYCPSSWCRNNGAGSGIASTGGSVLIATGTNARNNTLTKYSPAGASGTWAEDASNLGVIFWS